jgi:hypothetical protein
MYLKVISRGEKSEPNVQRKERRKKDNLTFLKLAKEKKKRKKKRGKEKKRKKEEKKEEKRLHTLLKLATGKKTRSQLGHF